jgi:hypothetical protein
MTTAMTSTALGLLLATSVSAQTGTGTPAPTTPAPATTAPDTTAPAGGGAPMAPDAGAVAPQSLSEMTVGDLNGTDVMDATGDKIGTIKDVVQGPGAGEAVIGIGGFLGFGQYEVALPLRDLSYEAEVEAIAVTMTREELEAKPEYDAAGRESLPSDTQLATLMQGGDAGTPAGDAPAALDAPVTEAPALQAPVTDETPADEVPQTDSETGERSTTD